MVCRVALALAYFFVQLHLEALAAEPVLRNYHQGVIVRLVIFDDLEEVLETVLGKILNVFDVIQKVFLMIFCSLFSDAPYRST